MNGIDGYLNDHLAGAAAAIRLAERCSPRANSGSKPCSSRSRRIAASSNG
jgi:hypothetical protein